MDEVKKQVHEILKKEKSITVGEIVKLMGQDPNELPESIRIMVCECPCILIDSIVDILALQYSR